MSNALGEVFKSGDAAVEDGVYQLIGDQPVMYERTDMSRVIRMRKGDTLPTHPDTGQPAQWTLIRIVKAWRNPEDLAAVHG